MGTKRGGKKTPNHKPTKLQTVSILLEKEHKPSQWPLCLTWEGKRAEISSCSSVPPALLLPAAPCQNPAARFGVMSRCKFLMVAVNVAEPRLCSADGWAASSAGQAVAFGSEVAQVLLVSSAPSSSSLRWFSWIGKSSIIGWHQMVISQGFLGDRIRVGMILGKRKPQTNGRFTYTLSHKQ